MREASADSVAGHDIRKLRCQEGRKDADNPAADICGEALSGASEIRWIHPG